MPSAGRAQEREAIREDVRTLPGVEEDLACECVEGAHLDGGGVRHRCAEAHRHPSREVLRGMIARVAHMVEVQEG